MATTTNYSWVTPDDTSLVKDGASAIRTLGSSIDTTTKALNPSTTLGDIEYRSSTANTNTRLGIGTSGQVLSVSGGVPAWVTSSAGSLTLLSTTSLSGASTTISSISQAYQHLEIYIYGVTNATASGAFICQPYNGATGLTTQGTQNTGATPSLTFGYPQRLSNDNSNDDKLLRTDSDNYWRMEISNYSSTTTQKAILTYGNYTTPNAGQYGKIGFGAIRDILPIDKLVLSNNGGNFSTGTVLIYGVK
jgi:hypothetical protein